MNDPEIALLVSSFQRPSYLRLALQSIAQQEGVEGKMELVVTDDGSTDETQQMVEEFARAVPFRVGFTTHPHTTYQLSRCRNEGVRDSHAPYLLFLDGDCILPRDHVRIHLQRRRPGWVMAGDCCRLEQGPSARINSEVVRSGAFTQWGSKSELLRLRKRHRASCFYRLIRHPTKPKLIGNNIGIWRADFERINGFDENFQGWGCEDDDLRFRLRRAGIRVASILHWTHTFHIWHPLEATVPLVWHEGCNVNYLLRKGRLTRCRNGLHKRDLEDLAIQVVGQTSQPKDAARLIDGRFRPKLAARPEVEILFLPGKGDFSGQADCNVLVALEPQSVPPRLAQQAHLMISPEGLEHGKDCLHFPLDQFDQALRSVA